MSGKAFFSGHAGRLKNDLFWCKTAFGGKASEKRLGPDAFPLKVTFLAKILGEKNAFPEFGDRKPKERNFEWAKCRMGGWVNKTA